MIAIDITKFLQSFPHVRGPAVFLYALICALLDRDIHFAFNPHFVGSQLYFNVVPARKFPMFWQNYIAGKSGSPIRRHLVVRVLKRLRNIAVRLMPRLTLWFPFLGRGMSRQPFTNSSVAVAHHSRFKQMLSFFPSDSLWGLPMPDTKKTLFLYDITFFEILRMIAAPVTSQSSPFIVQHIIDVNRAIAEAASLMVPTAYLARQLPLHFPAARNLPIDSIPLASTILGSPIDQENRLLYFKPLKKTGRKNSVLVVCGFDGFRNDNKGMGAILDIVCLQRKLFANTRLPHFTLVTPPHADLISRIEELNISDCVSVLSGLSVEQLIDQYKQAKFLWVHSIDEGFCLPVLEASMLGVPVLVSDVPSLRELWGDTVSFINVFNRYEGVNQLQAYCMSQSLGMRGANATHAQNYTIQKTVAGIWAALARVA